MQEVKQRIRSAQYEALKAVNKELDEAHIEMLNCSRRVIPFLIEVMEISSDNQF